MKKKKNFMKSNIVAFVLGALVFWAVNATAATLMESADVGYSNASSGSTATTVQGALDDLYAKSLCTIIDNASTVSPFNKMSILTKLLGLYPIIS